MGEENKEDKSKDGASEEKKEEEVKEEIVVKVDMHCEGCAKKVVRALRGFQGVEEVGVDRKANRVVVKGKSADPKMVCERISKKSGRKALLISPLPKPEPAQPAQPAVGDAAQKQPKDDTKQEDQENNHKQLEAAAVISVELRVQLHCQACAQQLRKRIRKLKGVESVETDVEKGVAIVKGVIADAGGLAEYVEKSTRKRVSIIKADNDHGTEQVGGENKGKEEAEDKADQEANKLPAGGNNINGEEEATNNNNNNKGDPQERQVVMGELVNRYEHYWPTRHSYMEMEMYNSLSHHPQFFSDDNPNACSLM